MAGSLATAVFSGFAILAPYLVLCVENTVEPGPLRVSEPRSRLVRAEPREAESITLAVSPTGVLTSDPSARGASLTEDVLVQGADISREDNQGAYAEDQPWRRKVPRRKSHPEMDTSKSKAVKARHHKSSSHEESEKAKSDIEKDHHHGHQKRHNRGSHSASAIEEAGAEAYHNDAAADSIDFDAKSEEMGSDGGDDEDEEEGDDTQTFDPVDEDGASDDEEEELVQQDVEDGDPGDTTRSEDVLGEASFMEEEASSPELDDGFLQDYLEEGEIPLRAKPFSSEELHAIMHEFDLDRDGRITAPEMKHFVLSRQSVLLQQEAEALFVLADENGDKKISWDEVHSTFAQGDDTPEAVELEHARFNASDADGDHALSLMEFVAYDSPDLDDSSAKSEAQSALQSLDNDKDGKLSLKEFSASSLSEEADMKDLDSDEDGHLNFTEVQELYSPDALEGAAVRNILKNLDKNGDGALDTKEWEAQAGILNSVSETLAVWERNGIFKSLPGESAEDISEV